MINPALLKLFGLTQEDIKKIQEFAKRLEEDEKILKENNMFLKRIIDILMEKEGEQ